MLHHDQSVRLGELCQKSFGHLERESAAIRKELQELRWDVSFAYQKALLSFLAQGEE